jgi:hypothetical protein
MAAERPIFIVGVHRSGTTLLRFMLSSNPRIFIPPESDFIPRFFLGRPHRPLTEERVERLLAIIFDKYRFAKEWQGARPDAAEFFRQMADPTPAAFLDLLYNRYAAQNGAVRWGDKTPIYASYIGLLQAIFPEAQFIHIIRDGRDVALSMLEKWGQKELHVDLYFAARNYVRRINHVRAAATHLPAGSFYEVHYERLVANPERELRAICRFLDESYVPEMVESHKLGQERIEPDSFHARVRRPPSTDQVGRWQREMSFSDQRLFGRVAGDLLHELGYSVPDLGAMTPADMARLIAYRAKYELLQGGRRLAQVFGLVPPI